MQPEQITFRWKERHYSEQISLEAIREGAEPTELNADGVPVSQWAETAAIGDTWTAAAGRYPGSKPATYTRIK